MRSFALLIALGVVLLLGPLSATSTAGPNENAVFAMHVIATDEYLDCSDCGQVGPFDCTLIDNSATPEEIAATQYGYGCIMLLVYNFTTICAVEFSIKGWPDSRGGPPLPAMEYCPATAVLFGDPWWGGGALGLGTEVSTPVPCGGAFCFGAGSATFLEWTPIILYYAGSSYTQPTCDKVVGPAPEWVMDCVSATHGCTIGGTHSEPLPYLDCDLEATPVRSETWSSVKALYR